MELQRYLMTLPWGTEPTEADAAWRIVFGHVGRWCDQIWLREAAVETLSDLVSEAEFERLGHLLSYYLPGPAPLTAELLALLTGWSSPSPLWNNQMLALIAYEWRLRSSGNDRLVSVDGMSMLTLWLTDPQAEDLRRALQEAGLDHHSLRLKA